MTSQDSPRLPEAFEHQMASLLEANEFMRFKAALFTPSKTSIRINPRKKAPLPQNTSPVPWNVKGHFLPQRPKFTFDPLFHAGAYYVQEASSMFIGHILNHIKPPKEGLYLDLCAAPGGKSSLLADYIGEEGLLVANEVIKTRASILRENMIKWGLGNTVVTNNDPAHFGSLEGFFDVVLVDAPCSGEGMFRKDAQAREEWSPENVKRCSARQQRILDQAGTLPGADGYLIYSTCTFNEQENEEMIRFLTDEFAYEPVQIPLDPEWGIVETETDTEWGTFYGYRFFPHLVSGEGFFITVLKRPSDAQFQQPKKMKDLKHILLQRTSKAEKNLLRQELTLNDTFDFYKLKKSFFAIKRAWTKHFEVLATTLNIKYFGTELGKFNKDQFIPTHALAISILPKNFPHYEARIEEAHTYLKKEDLDLNIQHDGWVILTYQNLPLGWVKNIGNRINNYYPKEWRIRMKIVD
ncbi:tRNA/rRNA cytosine-C5-methylase [Echinicola soli]|uniref:tRNA/rRNA cytosine-C5-methylase n=1 Tax=Echinicola soli TaxID=2591634 RepID=A0A514CEW1_9BACT|nr:tRNA/rRNA cytosine-C5-methylase [Echinicola soli]QDH78349.1 tRNA/rRNA cytosine-C5-methylase [Echinicola soli]